MSTRNINACSQPKEVRQPHTRKNFVTFYAGCFPFFHRQDTFLSFYIGYFPFFLCRIQYSSNVGTCFWSGKRRTHTRCHVLHLNQPIHEYISTLVFMLMSAYLYIHAHPHALSSAQTKHMLSPTCRSPLHITHIFVYPCVHANISLCTIVFTRMCICIYTHAYIHTFSPMYTRQPFAHMVGYRLHIYVR